MQGHSYKYFYKTIAICLLVMLTSVANSESAKHYQLNVVSQNIEQALRSLANASGKQLLFPYDQMKNLKSISITGRYTLKEALTIILKDTSLFGRLTEEGVILITPNQNKSERGREMMNSKKNLLAATVAFFVGGSGQAVFAQGDEGLEGIEWLLEEIVVTAQKREQNLSDVPISISVLGGDELDKSRFEGVAEALNQVAGVSTYASGQNGGVKISIRGVAASGPLFNGSSTVGYYVDDLPFGSVRSAIVPDTNAYDLGQVEVLRGPQGTLYGASAVNGVVRVLTNDANLDEHELKSRASLSSTEGGGLNQRVDFAANAALIEGKLGARLVVGYNDLSGWVDSATKDEANDGELSNIRLKLNAQPTDKLDAGLMVWRSRSDYGAANQANDDGLDTDSFDEPVMTDYDIYGLSFGYDFDNFTLTSATSYVDLTSTGVADVGLASILFTGLYSEVFSQEVHLKSTSDGVWRWSVGAFYRDAEDRVLQTLDGYIDAPLDTADKSKSYAVFGELTRKFMDDTLELTAGLRYFEDEVKKQENVRFTGITTEALYSSENTFDTVSPRLVLTWYPSEDLTVYGSYSEGFRSGFDQSPRVKASAPAALPIEEETLSNYEVGFKGATWDGQLIYDAAVYYMDWQDVQQTLGIPFAGSTLILPVNGESASGFGVDLAVTVTPVESLLLGLTFSWNDLTVDDDIISSGVVLFDRGERPSDSAEYTVGLSAGYSFPIGKFKGHFSGSVNYRSEFVRREIVGGTLNVCVLATVLRNLSFNN